MSEAETGALVKRLVAAFNAGDHEAMLAGVSEDVVHDASGGGREIGRNKFRWFLAQRARHCREEIGDLVVMTGEAGGRAAAEFTLRGTYLSTLEGLPEAGGQRYSLPAGAFFEIEGGLVSRITCCLDRAEWARQIAAH